MAQRMLTIQPTEQCSLWTTLAKLVAPVLAMDSRVPKSSDEVWAEIKTWLVTEDMTAVRMDSSNSHEVCTEAIVSHLGAKTELATQSRSPSECIVPKKGRVLGTDLSEGLMKIVSEHVRKNPSKRLKFQFGFSTDQTHEYYEEKSNTLIRTISCNNPEDNMKPLTKAIEDAFWTKLDKVNILVEGNELQMQYNSKPIFKSEVKAADRYIKSAVTLGRYKWLRLAQLKIIKLCGLYKSPSYAGHCRRKLMDHFGLQWRGKRTLERQYQPVRRNFPSPTDDALPTDWGKKLIEELIQCWFRGALASPGRSRPASFPFQWAFKCSSSSAEDINTLGSKLSMFASNLKAFICWLLRTFHKPPVIIRVTNSSDETLLTGPLDHSTRIKHTTGEAEGYKISISDADGPEIRRVLLCRSSNFYTALCDFMGVTDIDYSTNLEGHERRRVGSGEPVAPPSTTESRKRKHGRQAPS